MSATAIKKGPYTSYILRSRALYDEKLKKYGATRDAMNKAEEVGREFLQDFLRANDYELDNINKPYTWFIEELAKKGIYISYIFTYRIRTGVLYSCSLYQLLLICGYWGKTLPEMIALGQKLRAEDWQREQDRTKAA